MAIFRMLIEIAHRSETNRALGTLVRSVTRMTAPMFRDVVQGLEHPRTEITRKRITPKVHPPMKQQEGRIQKILVANVAVGVRVDLLQMSHEAFQRILLNVAMGAEIFRRRRNGNSPLFPFIPLDSRSLLPLLVAIVVLLVAMSEQLGSCPEFQLAKFTPENGFAAPAHDRSRNGVVTFHVLQHVFLAVEHQSARFADALGTGRGVSRFTLRGFSVYSAAVYHCFALDWPFFLYWWWWWKWWRFLLDAVFRNQLFLEFLLQGFESGSLLKKPFEGS